MNTTETTNLNLARKWRSKDFDHIIGQDLSVKILKNSLYLGQLFPVYLLSGQRGCGKTTTARVFAMAINCANLPAFQKNPKSVTLPCLACPSCVAMSQGKHPDFFEIDAASHTGVDTIRTIIDASQLLPLMGSKKIYLIDEAHMLSKASCNALLKILEEPPCSVLFMLATTDPQKIIETVRSRCFQLFFKPVESQVLVEHLETMCKKEEIIYTQDGLELIIQETGGSVRDAINLLEQVRFSSSSVSKQAVLQVLGHIDDAHIIAIMECIMQRRPANLLHLLDSIKFDSFSADFIWGRFVLLLRSLLWSKHGVHTQPFSTYHSATIQQLAQGISLTALHDMLAQFYAQETVFMKTTSKHALLEMILLQLCQRNSKKNKDENSPAGTPLMFQQEEPILEATDDDQEIEDEQEEDDLPEDSESRSWQQFLLAIEQLKDPLLVSIFKQGRMMQFDAANKKISVAFGQKLSFFSDWLLQTHALWQPLLTAHFGADVTLESHFIDHVQEKKAESVAPVVQAVQPRAPQATPASSVAPYKQKTYSNYAPRSSAQPKLNEPRFDVSDAATWPLANMLLKHFPGTITRIQEMKKND